MGKEQNRTKLKNLRNIGIMAHIDAGKTTVAERMLYYTGRTHRMGSTDDGNTTMDWMDQERERGITIVSAATSTDWRGHTINLIDTPGHVDFTVEVERSLRVLDGVVALFCGVGGVEPQSEIVWRQAEKYGVPAIAFINKMDRAGANFERVTQEIWERLEIKPVPVVIPMFDGDVFTGIIDIVESKAVYYNDKDLGATFHEEGVPDAYEEEFKKRREYLLHLVSEWDEGLFEKYCMDEPLEPGEIRRALRAATLSKEVIPVLCGSALKNKGVQRLMDAVVDYLPSPADLPPVIGVKKENGEEKEVEREHTGEDHLAALAFKVVSDRHMGKMVYVRVYSGEMNVGTYIYNSSRDARQRVGRLMRMHADRRENLEVLRCGEIGVAVGLSKTTTGDTLCAEEAPLHLEAIEFPAPVLSISAAPQSAAERDKLFDALGKLADEDPTFTVAHDRETGETIISGMGELHLNIICERLRRDFSVDPAIGEPKVAYRETITKPASVDYKYVKQTGGRGQYAHVELNIEPLEPGDGFEFIDSIRGGNIPKEYIPSVEKGIIEAMADGIYADTPAVDLAVDLVDGSFHEVDSSEKAFHACAKVAFKKAFMQASPQLLEPVCEVHIITPEEYSGSVTGSICSRRGRITNIEQRGERNVQAISGMVPLSGMFGYATELRGMTGGRGSFDMRFEHYEPVPHEIAEEIVRRKREEK